MTTKLMLDPKTTIDCLSFQNLSDKHQRYLRKVFRAIESGAELFQPASWLLDVTSYLFQLQSEVGLEDAKISQLLSALNKLPIQMLPAGSVEQIQLNLSLAFEHGISGREAGYLSAALQNQIEVVTFDTRLARVAGKLSVRF